MIFVLFLYNNILLAAQLSHSAQTPAQTVSWKKFGKSLMENVSC